MEIGICILSIKYLKPAFQKKFFFFFFLLIVKIVKQILFKFHDFLQIQSHRYEDSNKCFDILLN